MTIISVFICLFAERFLSSLHILRNYTWLHFYAQFILNVFGAIRFNEGKVRVLFIVLPPAILVGFIDYQLYKSFLPLEFLFSVAVLLYSFGPQTFYERSKSLCDAENINDNACACWYAEKILARPLDRHEKINLPYTIAQSLFTISNDRILAPIFWFALLGPLGAILFRCSSQLYFLTLKNEQEEVAQKNIAAAANGFYAILNWVPSRLSALGFAAMGNFSGAVKNYSKLEHKLVDLNQKSNEELLITMGSGAINLPENPSEATSKSVSEALAILRRNTQLWMGTIALLTLAGWLS